MFFKQLSNAQLRLYGVNAVIACLLALTLLDATPFLPHQIRKVTAEPIVKALGNWQTHWDLFGPNPDHLNSHLFAKLEYQDGTITEWHAPEWRKQSRWERFWNHRYHRYIETMTDPGYAAAWPALTKQILLQQRVKDGRADAPRKIIVYIKDGLVPDAHFHPWQPLSELIPLHNQYELYREELP